jgi:Family of unknown function (DUF6221)
MGAVLAPEIQEMVTFLHDRFAEEEADALAASGGTVIGREGDWRPSPAGDEWEALPGAGAEELLVALRPGLPRPPDVFGGLWGALVTKQFDDEDGPTWMPLFRHMARHDPAAALAGVRMKRELLAFAIHLHQDAQHLAEEIPEGASIQLQACVLAAMHGQAGVTVKLLAGLYCRHPGWKPAWRLNERP